MPNYLEPDWPAPQTIRAFNTTRQGGVSEAPYASMNLGFHVNDDPAALANNHQRLKTDLHLPETPKWLHQVHGNHAVHIDEAKENTQADACFTQTPNRICAVMTADCLPVLICNAAGTEVAAIHAGWRGLLSGVIDATVSQLQSDPSDLMAWLGPAIGPEVFELNEQIKVDFLNNNPQNSACFNQRGAAIYADIYQLARVNLNRCGINIIYGGTYCTVRDETLFYSYRRDNGTTGRMASLIWIAPT